MAEDNPNRFVGHDGEVEVESDEDEIPREWPAYRRAYAAFCRARADSKDGILGSNWQLLASSCGTTSLGTYKTRMRKLRQTHMARPEWGPYKFVEHVVCDAIREGKGSSSVKTILNAAAMAYTMGGFWQERRSSMTAKSTRFGLPVRFQDWPSNGCNSARGLHKGAGTSTSSSGWSLRTNCKMSWQTSCVDPSGRTSDGMRGDAWSQRPCTRLGASSLASRRGSGGGAQGRQWPTSTARTQGASGTRSRHLPPPVTSRGSHGLREQQPGDARNSGHLRPTISLRGTLRRATLEIPHALGHPRTAPHLGRPMAGGVRGDAAREEAAGRTGCGVVGEGRESMHVSPGNKVDGQHKPRRMKSLMGVGGGRAAAAWVTYRRARSCAWSASRRVEQVSDVPQNELFRAALAVILQARERLRDVDGGQAHLEKILSHMEAPHELNWDLLGQDYDGYDGDGPSGGISEGMIAAGLGERGSLDIPLDVWNANIPTRLIWDIRSWKSGPDCGRFDVWQPSLHTRRMIGVLVDDGFLCRDPGCLGALEWEDLTDNVSAFVKPKNDVKCSFIIDIEI